MEIERDLHLIEIIGEENRGRDNARSCGSLHVNLNTAEEDVPSRLDGRGIALGLDDELGTIGGVAGIALADRAPIAAVIALAEVVVVGGRESVIIVASCSTEA